MAATEYVVLRRSEEAQHWIEAGPTYTARSAADAIRQRANADTFGDGVYVAIPARSWKPVTVTAQTTTVLKLEAAK